MTTRSWTETIGNTVLYSGLDSTAYLNWLSERPLADDHLLSTFLHEYTHKWTFNSLVGNALAHVELRIAAFTRWFPDGRSVWARDYAAFRCLSAFYRPLAEGLAQFAEFDLQVAKTDFKLGTPVTAANLCFAGEGQTAASFSFARLRHAAGLLERKGSLYLHDFEVREGYLRLWLTAIFRR